MLELRRITSEALIPSAWARLSASDFNEVRDERLQRTSCRSPSRDDHLFAEAILRLEREGLERLVDDGLATPQVSVNSFRPAPPPNSASAVVRRRGIE